jgi:hypothetical protein
MRLRTEDKDGKFEVNKANLVKLDAPVKFPPLWSSNAQAVTATDADPQVGASSSGLSAAGFCQR